MEHDGGGRWRGPAGGHDDGGHPAHGCGGLAAHEDGRAAVERGVACGLARVRDAVLRHEHGGHLLKGEGEGEGEGECEGEGEG